MKGTFLNTGTVLVGSLLGLAAGRALPTAAQDVALSGLGLVSLGMGLKMFLGSKNVLIVAASIALGGIFGMLLGLQGFLNTLAESVKSAVGGGGTFSEGLVAATVLFCVGPMTLLGCIQDGLEGKSELLNLKSTLDGVAAFFLATSLGVGVVFSAISVLVIQGGLTLCAKPLSRVKEDEELLAELTGTGGPIMIAIGFSLLSIKKLPTADYIPALILGPALVVMSRRLKIRKLTP